MVKINIDFVSDVACPWCAVGLGGLLEAMRRVEGVAQVDLHFRPFELNPDMPAGGQNTIERLMSKYGYDREQVQANRKVISERAAAVGMPMRMEDDNRSFNTFDAHRLIHWAGLQGQAQQTAMKQSLLRTYHFLNQDTSDAQVLALAASEAGLDERAAREVLASGRYADEVRAEEAQWRQLGITSVPSVIINGKYLVSGGQPPEAFEQALRQVAGEG
ncbi:DsbA family oxidoreductase [Achromobacter arsenitoxydans]|uniref:2-hydroxychromene-2-carboxylate isomerase family protein n=1 Tax=Achromobacter arsenitoxydans SY8 TaxID=477184 RepID=H0F2J2_9BURK|nr:DsbA family oxidoreductase [Achromobacter arsenitoxydans]EHK67603.1 2-hydroxychromene-2-carboxylate isomerase family protein [Achromobacter arsenitoxydans SY8]